MRKALVVYESMFGNTHAVADAVAEGLQAHYRVAVVDVTRATPDAADDADLLVVGGPTHAFSMSRTSTRKSAEEQGADAEAAQGQGIREWISTASLPRGIPVAAFDTKVVKPHLPGSAAHAADRKLRRRGFRHVTDPATFYVTGTTGDLVDGELTRAKTWGESLRPQ